MSEWCHLTLDEVATVDKGKKPARVVETEAAFPYLIADTLRTGSRSKWVVDADGCVISDTKDTLVLWDGAGAGDVFPGEYGIVASTMGRVRAVNEHLVPEWLTLVLRGAQPLLKSTTRGTTVPHIDPSTLKRLPVPVPPLTEQRRIVHLMESLDAHIEALEEEVAMLAVTLTSARETLGGDLHSEIGAVAARDGIQIGPFGSQLHAHEYADDGVPVVMPKNLRGGEIIEEGIKRVPSEVADRLPKHRLETGDIVFPRRGDLSKRALVTENQQGWVCGTGCLRVRLSDRDEAAVIFQMLSNSTTTRWLEEHAVGTTMLNVNTTIISNVPVAALDGSARRLAAACREIDIARRAAQAETARLRDARAAMLAALLSQSIAIPESYDELLGVLEVAA